MLTLTYPEAVAALERDYGVPAEHARRAVDTARRHDEKAEPVKGGYVVVRRHGGLPARYILEPHLLTRG
jgi:hypothetical protein